MAWGSQLLLSIRGRSKSLFPKTQPTPMHCSLLRMLRFTAQPFVAGPAHHAGGRSIAEQGGADLLLIGPALDVEAVHLLLTASINHPQTVPFWVQAKQVSFAVAA